MKKLKPVLAIIILICMTGCKSAPAKPEDHSFPEKKTEADTSQDDAKDNSEVKELQSKLYKAVTETMPAEVVEEIEEHGVWHTLEGGEDYLLANSDDYEAVTLRLDFSFKDGKLIQYVSKDYGFVQSDVADQVIDENQAEELVLSFAVWFCGKQMLEKEDLKKIDVPAKWEGGDYACYEDPDGDSYLVWLSKGMVIHYDTPEMME